MAVLMYTGPWDMRPLWGVDFPKGKSVEVDDPALVEKALRLDGFVRVDAEEEDPEPVSAPDPDDYGPAPEAEAFEELKIPAVGAGLVPEGWEGLHWKQRVKLAKDLTGKECANGTEADEAIREALEPR